MPEYYGITQGEDGAPLNGTAEVIIAKHRNGKLDTVAAQVCWEVYKVYLQVGYHA